MSDENMSGYQLQIQQEAAAEILDAYQWYEERAQGLGMAFERAVDASLAAIMRNPTTYPVVYNQLRRALLRRFPYSLYYLLMERKVVIVACLHSSRDPKEWQKRADDLNTQA